MEVRPEDNQIKRPVDATPFSDLTSAKQTGDAYWREDGTLVIPFDREPSAAEQKAIVRRLCTADAAEEARVKAMQECLAAIPEEPGTLATPSESAAVRKAVRLLLLCELRGLP